MASAGLEITATLRTGAHDSFMLCAQLSCTQTPSAAPGTPHVQGFVALDMLHIMTASWVHLCCREHELRPLPPRGGGRGGGRFDDPAGAAGGYTSETPCMCKIMKLLAGRLQAADACAVACRSICRRAAT